MIRETLLPPIPLEVVGRIIFFQRSANSLLDFEHPFRLCALQRSLELSLFAHTEYVAKQTGHQPRRVFCAAECLPLIGVFPREARFGCRLSNHFSSEAFISLDGRPCNSPSTPTSSSRSDTSRFFPGQNHVPFMNRVSCHPAYRGSTAVLHDGHTFRNRARHV